MSQIQIRERQTFDLNTIPQGGVLPIQPDSQKVILKAVVDMLGDKRFYIAHHRKPVFEIIQPFKSLHYAHYSHGLDVVGPHLLQLSLAMCLHLYSVSRSIEYHREFAGKFLIDLPEGNFYKTLTVPI